MHESSSARLSFKSITTDLDSDTKIKVVNEPTQPLVGILKNGSAKQNPEAEKLTKDNSSVKGESDLLHFCILLNHAQNLLSSIESQLNDQEPVKDSLVNGSQSSLRTANSDDDANETDLLVSIEPVPLANAAPLSSISEVTLDKFDTE